MKKNEKNADEQSKKDQIDEEIETESLGEVESTKIEIEKEDTNSEEVQGQQEETQNSESKIAELQKEISALNDALLRKAAEFENYKRRNENDQSNLIKYAAEGFILRILPVYDDLERSLNHIKDDNTNKSLKDGLNLVFDKFSKILEDHGVRKIESVGKPFDFNYHEALMQREEEGVAPHTVIEEIESGYMYKDKVLRHSKVIVSQESAANGINPEEKFQTNSSEENN